MKKDRIPPLNAKAKELTPVTWVAFSQLQLKGNDAIWYQVEGGSAVNGQATLLNDKKQESPDGVSVQASGDVIALVGTSQTQPSLDADQLPIFTGGNAGKLTLVAYDYNLGTKKKGPELARSAGFSVASIPIPIVVNEPVISKPKAYPQNGNYTPPNKAPWSVSWSAAYFLTDVSDGGNADALKYVQIGERLLTQTDPTGYYGPDGVKYQAPANVQWSLLGRSAEKPGRTDLIGEGRTVNEKTEAEAIDNAYKQIATILDKLTSGTLVLDQIGVFADAQLGIPPNADGKDDPLIAASGFQHLEVIQKKGGQYYLHISLTAHANHDTKAGGVSETVKPVDIEIKPVPKSVQG